MKSHRTRIGWDEDIVKELLQGVRFAFNLLRRHAYLELGLRSMSCFNYIRIAEDICSSHSGRAVDWCLIFPGGGGGGDVESECRPCSCSGNCPSGPGQ